MPNEPAPSEASAIAGAQTSASRAFFHLLTKIEKNKINRSIAIRNTLAVVIPLGLGMAFHYPLAGVAIASGALNVSYSDGNDPYAHRARRMLGWSALGALAAFLGSITGYFSLLAVSVAAIWAFVAGLSISVSTRAGDLGLNTLVTCVIYGARGASSPAGAADAGLLVLGGGLLQMLMALLLWPVRRHSPERQAVGTVYQDLAHELSQTLDDDRLFLPPTLPAAAQDTIAALGRDGSIESARFRVLFDQAARVRLSTFRLRRLQTEHEGVQSDDSTAEDAIASVHELLSLCPRMLLEAAQYLLTNTMAASQSTLIAELDAILAFVHDANATGCMEPEIAAAMDALGGQLRTVLSLAENTVTTIETEFERAQASHSWRLQVGNWLSTLRANLDWRSAFFRHAIRLAACVVIGDGMGRIFSWQRTYWIPMTIAVVLKPDFASTFSRGLLRLAGTFTGLIIATLLYHALPSTPWRELLLVLLFTLILRSLGPANYGVFSTAISGLIVFLIAATGVSPKEVVAERAVNTAIGGVFALLAYAIWPTWERKNIFELMAQLIDATRQYFQGIEAAFRQEAPFEAATLDEQRDNWRRARADAETSLDRLGTEPRVQHEQVQLLASMLASSRAVMVTMLGLEAGLSHSVDGAAPPEFERFAHDVEFTLYFLSSALRGSHAAFDALPLLRQDHTALLQAAKRSASPHHFVLVETDRMTVALNTLREQVFQFLQQSMPVVAA